jgi:hypothetical protein
MTVFDHALTRPRSVHKKYERNPKDVQPIWYEDICPEGQAQMRVGKERYYLSADGYLMPVKKGQAPPDPRYFERAGKQRQRPRSPIRSPRRRGRAASAARRSRARVRS